MASPTDAKAPSPSDAIEAELAGVPGLSLGLMSAAQGSYTTAQLALDITQGARISTSSYSPGRPPALALLPIEQAHTLSLGPLPPPRASVEPWPTVIARARDVPADLRPGLLASSIPGGAGYVGIAGTDNVDGVAAADRSGIVAAVSLGPVATLAARVVAARGQKRLVVADLPAGAAGATELRALSATRGPGELEIVVQRAPDRAGNELLWVAVAGLGGGHSLTSQTTNQRGLVAAIDLAPTILEWLGLPVPSAVHGKPIETSGTFDGRYLRSLKDRLLVLYARRLPALALLLGAWALATLAARLLPLSPPSRSRAQARVARVGALALLWTPVAVLITAALEPGRWVEYALLVILCLALGALTDRLPWPRAPLAPAIVAVVGLTADALSGTQLLMRSLLGPNPALGVRFYGIGNELKSGLAALVFAAVAAALYPVASRGPTQPADVKRRIHGWGPAVSTAPGGHRSGRPATVMASAGIVLAVVEGSARIGAGVGGVILVSAGTAVATLLLLPGRIAGEGSSGARPRTVAVRRTLIVLAAPFVGLLLLAALDLATAHGGGHYTGSVLHAHSVADLRDIVERRYTAAYGELKHGLMPLATALALLATALGIRHHQRLLAPVAGDPAWLAALAGGLAAGVVGALTEDSGPVLLVVAVFTVGCLLAYLRSPPSNTSRRVPRPEQQAVELSHPKLTA
ncbi:MAG TPA: hypothetical protein VGG98_08160 [Solirubrobacteraceae bacterium]